MAPPRNTPQTDEVKADEAGADAAEGTAAEEANAAPQEDLNGVAPEERDRKGTPEFSYRRLLADAGQLTGHPAHVLAGALAGKEDNYYTADEAKELAAEWLQQPDSTGKEG